MYQHVIIEPHAVELRGDVGVPGLVQLDGNDDDELYHDAPKGGAVLTCGTPDALSSSR